jgi:glucan 1,3-beta-glucosidase
MPRGKYVGVAMDTHIYQMFSNDVCRPSNPWHNLLIPFSLFLYYPQSVSLNETEHIRSACNNAKGLSDFNLNQLWTIVGEWTPAMTDCTKYLNGRGVGARYDGSISKGAQRYGRCDDKTGQGSSFSQDYKEFLRRMWEAQVNT